VINTRTIVLLLAALGLLVILPLFLSPNLLNAAIKMMIAALFALAFTLAMGQAGMLSFGHAAYYGLGAFAALHLMRAVEQKLFGFPTPLIPLAGALAGFVFGLAFGWFATQRTGVYFSMVTLALAELLLTLAPTWNALFGGESGIATMRGPSWGVSFGSDADVYYLTLAWFVVSAWCMWAFTRTPVGRLALALRDNEQRVRFLGFNAHVARTLIFAISCLFTGYFILCRVSQRRAMNRTTETGQGCTQMKSSLLVECSTYFYRFLKQPNHLVMPLTASAARLHPLLSRNRVVARSLPNAGRSLTSPVIQKLAVLVIA